MDFVTGEHVQTARWEIVSHNNFIFIDKFILFWKQCPFEILVRKWIFYQARGKQTERAEQLQHNRNFTEATAAEMRSLKWAQYIDFVIK